MTCRSRCSPAPAAAALLCFVAAVAGAQGGESLESATTLIAGVTVISMAGEGVIPNASVLVVDGKIERILRDGAGKLPPASRIIDGKGRFLIPGLVDAHVHYDNDVELTSFLRHGVTTVLSLGRSADALPRLAAVQRRIAAGDFPGPRIYATGPTLSNHVKIAEPAAAREFVRSLARDGYSFVKLYNDTSREVFDAVVDEADRLGLGVFGHIPRGFPPEHAISGGLDVVAHMEELFFTFLGGPRDAALDSLTPSWAPDPARFEPMLDLFHRHEVAIIPNLVASHSFMNLWVDEDAELGSPEAQYQPADVTESWRQGHYARRSNVAKRMVRERLKFPILQTLTWRAHEKGILLVAGSDAPIPALFPGKSLHEELRLLVATGLSHEEALATATRNAGTLVRRFVDREACIGVVREGCEADLVLLAADPLADIRAAEQVVGVMTDGRWYAREELEVAARPGAVEGVDARE